MAKVRLPLVPFIKKSINYEGQKYFINYSFYIQSFVFKWVDIFVQLVKTSKFPTSNSILPTKQNIANARFVISEWRYSFSFILKSLKIRINMLFWMGRCLNGESL